MSLDTDFAVIAALADEERLERILKKDRALLDEAKWPCPFCLQKTGSMAGYDVHVRFACVALGRP